MCCYGNLVLVNAPLVCRVSGIEELAIDKIWNQILADGYKYSAMLHKGTLFAHQVQELFESNQLLFDEVIQKLPASAQLLTRIKVLC